MPKYGSCVNRNRNKKAAMDRGNSICLGCGEHLAYCGEPFTAQIRCPKCGAVNVYEESQQPSRVLGQSEDHVEDRQHSV